MRCVRTFLAALLGLLLLTSSASSQGGKDTKPKAPTEWGGKTFDKWNEEIRDPYDASVRQTAIRAVLQFGPAATKATPNLISAIAENDASIRSDAASALGLVLPHLDPNKDDLFKKGVTALNSHILDEQRPVRLHVINSLAVLGPYAQSTIGNLNGALVDGQSWEVRRAAAAALGRVAVAADPKEGPDGRALKALTNAVSDACAPVRLEAINSLWMLGLPPRIADADLEKRALEARMKNDRDKVVSLSARALLMNFDEKYLTRVNLDALAKPLDDIDIRLRVASANLLGMLGKKAKTKVPELVNAAGDKDYDLALAAVVAMGRIEDAAAVPTLTRMMRSPNTDMRLRCQAARTLGSLGENAKESLPELVATLGEKEPALVSAAIAGIALMGESGKAALPDVKKLTESTNEEIKAHAVEAVKFLEKKSK